MSLEQINSMHTQRKILYNPLLLGLEFSQRFSDIMYGGMRDFYRSLATQDNQDPFQETKKKCLPDSIDHLSMEERLLVKMENSYFICTPLTIEKRDGPSFSDKTMNNLIIDDSEMLMQLLFTGNPSSQLPPGQKMMQVTEYKKGGKTVARKFEKYI